MERSFRTALVLSGGGSRGAYEVGVLLYLREKLGPRVGRPVPIDIVAGTSVGAINGAYLAATMERPELQGREMARSWRSLELEKLITLRAADMFRLGRTVFGTEPPPPSPDAFKYGGLLDTSGLEHFVITSIPWRQIRKNLLANKLRALTVSATMVGTGHTVVFIDAAKGVEIGGTRQPYTEHRRAAIGPRHTLASAAIPLLFPSVKVSGSFYVDGGLRQNTPLSPAIRLGADRILVISLRYKGRQDDTVTEHAREVAYPKPLFLAGKALNALLLDHTDYDLERMQRLNAVLEAGTNAFGDEFLELINREMEKLRGAPLRPVAAVHIHPSQDIGAIASDFVEKGWVDVKSRVTRRMLSRLAKGEAHHESDLLSYLLFDGRFADALIELGFHDASKHEDELVKLFT